MSQTFFKTQAMIMLFVLILSITSCARGGPPDPIYQKIKPGDTSIQSERISAHRIQYKKSTVSMNYTMVAVEQKGIPLWQIDIDFNSGASSKPDRIWFDTRTLAFRGRLLPLADYTIDVKMDEGLFSGNLTPTDGSDYSPIQYNKTYPHDAFEPAIINYFIGALPLQVGYTASIPVFDLNNGSQMLWSNISVVDEEIVTIDGQTFDTWKVISDGIKKKTIWVSKQYPFAIKMQTSGNFGSWLIVPSSIELS